MLNLSEGIIYYIYNHAHFSRTAGTGPGVTCPQQHELTYYFAGAVVES